MSSQQMSTRDRAVEYFQNLAPGPAKTGEATDTYNDIDDLAYALSRVPMFTPRQVRIIAIGAGFAGISMARAVNTGSIRNATMTVYEKNNNIGGTWYENRYPGYVFIWAAIVFRRLVEIQLKHILNLMLVQRLIFY